VITPEEAEGFRGTGIDKMGFDQAGDVEISLQRVDNAVVIPAKQGFCLLQRDRIHPLSPAFPMFRRKRLVIERSFERIVYTADAYTSENIAHCMQALIRGYFALECAGFRQDELAFSASHFASCRHVQSTACPDAQVFERNKAYRVDALYVVPRLNHRALRLYTPAIEFLSRLGGKSEGRATDRRIYVSRRDSARRRLVNEAELETRLAGLGFESIIAGEFSPQDQIAAFRDAAMIVAPHGAALTNVLFMTEGASLLELKSPLTGTLTFQAFSKLRGIDYQHIMGTAVDAESGVWSIDVDAVIARVRDLLPTAGRRAEP
jgi:hypothetical protein